MPIDHEIMSPSNPRIKTLVALRERRHRDGKGIFLVEGERALLRALDAGHRPLETYYDPAAFRPPGADLGTILTCSETALSKASYRGRSQGVIALFEQFDVSLDSVGAGDNPLILMLEGIEKPGNLGAILRTADAVGADAVIAVAPETDVFNPNVIRASTGAVFTVSLAVAELSDAVVWLRDRRIEIQAADPSSRIHFWSADLSGPAALLVGTEAHGLTPDARSAADTLLSIPMRGHAADSLNASVSMALLAYEALRQRDAKP